MASAAARGLLEGTGAPPPKIRLAAVSPLPREWQPARGPDPTAIEKQNRFVRSVVARFGCGFGRGGSTSGRLGKNILDQVIREEEGSFLQVIR